MRPGLGASPPVVLRGESLAKHHALFATARFHDQVVEERFVRRGEALQIGNDPSLAVPVPHGFPYLARCEWVSATELRVVDGRGRQYVLDPDHDVDIRIGPVGLHLSLAPQFPLKRMSAPSWKGSIAWLTIVLMTTALMQQGELLWAKRCEWFGICPSAPAAQPGWHVDVTAEYLARLLREDYAGADEQGVIAKEIDRPDAARITEERHQFYMPAGNQGPVTRMGGAAETAPEPVRTPVRKEPEPVVSGAPEAKQQLVAEEVGTPIPMQPNEPQDEGVADAEADDGDELAPQAPAEEEEGWGLQDWYDEKDRRIEQLEIEVMLEVAKRQLKIDPDDQEALSILSYYQYLAEDYDAAMRTYQRYIALYPDEPAGFNNMALVYKRQGRYAEEERLYRVALALEPLDTTAMNNLAVNLAHQGRYDEALALMRQIEQLDPDDPYADLHRAKIHAEMGDEAKALEYLERALERMAKLDTLHHIEFRQDIRLDPSFEKLRQTRGFREILLKYYGDDTPLKE